MKTVEEEYLEYLEDLIRRQKGKSCYLSRDSSSYDPDIESIIQQFFRENPDVSDSELADTLLARVEAETIHAGNMEEVSNYLSKKEKGSVHTWQDENGKSWYFFVTGSSDDRKKRQHNGAGNNFETVDKDSLRDYISRSMVKKDIKKIYDRKRTEQDKEYNKQKSFSVSDLRRKHSFQSSAAAKTVECTGAAGGFEKLFKDMVREQGSLCVSSSVAYTILDGMSGQGLKQLDESFKLNGIKNRGDFDSLLEQWKNEALNPGFSIALSRKPERENAVREYSAGHSR